MDIRLNHYSRRFRTLLAIVAAGLVVSPPAISQEDTQTPGWQLVPAQARWPLLSESRDPQLQKALVSKLRKMDLLRYCVDGRLMVALVDITDIRNPRMASINTFDMIYAASLPKIAIMLGAYQAAQDGRLVMDAALEDLIQKMIRNSSNWAATAVLNRVGMEYLADVLMSERYLLYDDDSNGGLWVGKAYAKKQAWRRDPINNTSHGASPYEVARFYYLLETGRLVSPEASARMKEMLSQPAIKHKFVLGLSKSRPDAQVYRKSGTWQTYHSDSAIIERGDRKYIAVALANSPQGGQWLSRLIVGFDELIFDPKNVARGEQAKKARIAFSLSPEIDSSPDH